MPRAIWSGAADAKPDARAPDAARSMTRHRPGRLLRPLLRMPVRLYDWRLGWLLGHRFLLLEHTGRRTGRAYKTVLEVVEYRPDTRAAVVVSGFGANVDWLRNIGAPDARTPRIVIGRDSFIADHS